MASHGVTTTQLRKPTYEPDGPTVPSGRFGADLERAGRHFSNARINALVCMFNGFALARPFCDRMKIAALGRSARDAMRHRGAGAAITRAGSGDVESDGVARPLHVSRHDGRVRDRSRQPDRRDL